MKPSRVLREIRENEVAAVAKLNILHPAVISLAGLAGYSAVWLCNEHGPIDWSMLENGVRAARNHDTDVIIRVAKGSYSDYIKPFECDAAGIMVPHVATPEEAAQVVETCRTYPLGKRPMDGGNADGDYCQLPVDQYARMLNEEKFIILQIESPEAVERVEEIAAVPGYDFLLFGPGDYSHRIGKIGQIGLPEVDVARRKVEQAALRHGKKCFNVGLPLGPAELKERGYYLSSVTADVTSLGKSFAESLKSFRAKGNDEKYYERK